MVLDQTRRSPRVCVCVCVFSSHLLAAVPLFKARRALHSAGVSRGLHLFSVFFCPTRTNRGNTGGGKHRGFFLLFMFIVCPIVLLRCLPSFFIARRVRLSLSLVNTKVEFCLLTKLFRYRLSRFPLPGTKVRKKPTLAEIRTRDLAARRLRGYRLDHRGDRCIPVF